ncbi:effector-associated constant component EACC1 [Embleya sp. NPDC001921]
MRVVDTGTDIDAEEAVRLTEGLAAWLTEDRDVALYARVERIRTPPPEGGMSGGAIEWIGLATTAGFSAASLAYAHMSYRLALPRSRRSVPIVITRDDLRIVVEDGSAETAARIIQALSDAPDPAVDDPPATEDGDGGRP